MKKILLITSLFFLVGPIASAHPGNTDSSGCHTCRTNCSSWGLYTGEYHCHKAKGLSQPEDPIKSTYGAGGTGYTSPAPEYKAPTYSRPNCSSMSTYSYSSDKCECMSGYIEDSGSCVSGNSICIRKLGYGSKYNSISKECECNYGYIMTGGKCKSESDYCNDSLGFNSKYNSLYEKCECNYGYKLYENKCVGEDEYCEKSVGNNARYNSLNDKCECNYGYIFDGSNCVIEDDGKEVYLPVNSSQKKSNIKENEEGNENNEENSNQKEFVEAESIENNNETKKETFSSGEKFFMSVSGPIGGIYYFIKILF